MLSSITPAKITQRSLTFLAGALLLVGFAVPARSQSQTDNTSVAEAARRAREQKRNASKPARTITNEDLPAAPVQPAAETAAAMPSSDSDNIDQAKPDQVKLDVEKTGGQSPEAVDNLTRKKAETEAALKRAKVELAQAQGELDVLQRKSALDTDSFYSQTNFAGDAAGKARLDAEAQQVSDKKSQVEALKAKVAALQAELGNAVEPTQQ